MTGLSRVSKTANIAIMKPILVTGASGLFGGEVARQLVAKGYPVRLLVRDAARAPELGVAAEIVVGDYLDSAALARAMAGIDKMFLATYDHPQIVAHQANLLSVAMDSGIGHIVRLSSDGTEENRGLPVFDWHRECEQQLERSGIDYTHVKPQWVMHNFESFVVDDRIRLPAGDGRIGLVDQRDVAAVAVLSLIEDLHAGQAYVLGTESLSHAEVAAQLSEATGRSIVYEDIDPAVYQQELEAAEWDRESIDSMLGLFADVRAGVNSDADIDDSVRPLLGRPGIHFRQFAEDFASRIGNSA